MHTDIVSIVRTGEVSQVSLKKAIHHQVKEVIDKVNTILRKISSQTIRKTNDLISSFRMYRAEKIKLKEK